ncbi:uncharacterized protein LOC135197291 [Macrobrachium nipponense]|uniref:uncharacterized protein LOC135197291 n=1 Tax=Macrobrachium nipponense TaxID=159736 RepID=UPI0030C88336
MSSSHAMQSSLRDVLGWVWQTVMSWLASITSRFDDHLCLERPTPEMVVKAAADPEMAVENDAKVPVEGGGGGEGGARVEKTIDAVLYIEEEDAKIDQMEDNLLSRDSEEIPQTAEHELVISDDHNGSLNASTTGAAEEGGHSDPAVNGASASEDSAAATDSAEKENAPDESEASEDSSNEDIDDIFPFADSIFGSSAPPRKPKDRRGPSDTNNKGTTRNKGKNPHNVNEDDPWVEGEAGKEKEEEDTSVTWMVKVGLTKESYERALYPQYYVLEFRSAVSLEKEMVETALKQLRSLLPWLGLGLKRRKKEMWLCLHPEGNINFKMTYGDSSLWDVIANSCDEFAYTEDKLLHSFMLMNAQPCSQCQAFVDGSACGNSETLCESSEHSASGELSSAESSNCCHAPGITTAVQGDTTGETSSAESSNCCHAPSITIAVQGGTAGEPSSAESSNCCHDPGITTAVQGRTAGEPSSAESSNCCHAPGITTAVQCSTTGGCSSAESSNCCHAPGITTAVQGGTAGEPSSAESSNICHAPGISTATVDDACRDKNSESDEILSSATGSDSKCPSPTSVSCSPVDSADKIPLPVSEMSPSVIVNNPPSQEASSNCASETVSYENAPVEESQKPTPVTISEKVKSFPHNYRLVFGVPQSLADEKSFSAICDGFILKLSTLISESAKASASSDSTGDVSEHSGKEECDGRSSESVQKTKNESAGEESDETPSQSNSDVRRVDLISDEMANILQHFSVVADVLVTDENSESGESAVPNNDASKIDRNSPHVDRTLQSDCTKNFMNKCKSERISFISGFASCLNAAISRTLVKGEVWKDDDHLSEKEDLNISYSISHYYNMDDLYDHEWRDRPDEENANDDDDGDNEDLVYSVCCRKPTLSLRGNPRTGLKGAAWETARIVDQKRKAAELLQSRNNTLPQIIPLNLENLTVSDSQFPSIFHPECSISITRVTDSPRARLDRRLENVELLSCHPIHPAIFFFMTTCITLRVQEGLLAFSFYHRQQFLPNSAAHEFADEVESAVVSSVKGS